MEILVLPAVGELMDKRGVAVEGEEDGLVLGKEHVILGVGQAVGVLGLEVEQRKRQLRRIISFLFLQENQQPARQNPSDRRAFSFNFSILHSNPSFFRQGFCNPLGLQFFLRHAILKSAVLYNRISPNETLRILSPGKGN